MKIRYKLFFLGLLSLGSLAAVTAIHVSNDIKRRTVQRDLETAITRSALLSNLVHEIQIERGRSAIYLTTLAKNTGPLREQWRKIDQILANFPVSLPEIADLAGNRQRIANHTEDFETAFNFYSSAIQNLIDQMSEMVIHSQNPQIRDLLVAHSNLVQAKEFMGRLRAAMARELVHAQNNPSTLATINSYYALSTDSIRRFRLPARAEDIAAYQKLDDSPAMGRTRAALMALLAHTGEAITPEAWFSTISEVIDDMKKIEDQSLAGIRQDSEIYAATLNRKSTLKTALLAIISLMILAVLFFTIVGLLRALGQASRGVTTIMETKDFSQRLPQSAKDEIGAISRSFNDLLAVAERLISEKDHLASTDSLTGIRNRLKFIQSTEGELLRSQRYGSPLSLVMMDIDFFKRINDTFGHPVGDEVLKGVAYRITQSIRATDTFARWGGEEFILLLPGNSASAAYQLAEKLRAVISESEFEKAGTVTASFGVAEFCPEDDVGSLCQRADEAMYRSKHEGRNRVCMAPSP